MTSGNHIEATHHDPKHPSGFVRLLAAGLVGAATAAAHGQGLAISWFTIDGGGGRSFGPGGSGLAITGTIGQHDAGVAMVGGGLRLEGGFWASARPAPPACVADVDDGSGSGTPDGGVTIDDLLYYLALFDAGVIRADIDDGSGTGVRDGGVTIDDLLYYLVRFESGC